MPYRGLLVILVGFSLLCAAGATCCAQAGADEAGGQFFNDRLTPFLQQYCVSCHSGEEPQAKLALDSYRDAAALRADATRWSQVVEYLAAGIMPPADELQPSPTEVVEITHWIGAELARLGDGNQNNPGRVTIRRLNRVEYNNTIRDLVGIDYRPAEDFPSDDVGYGFDNIGDVLSLPPILMEKYLAAAERIATQAVQAPWPPPATERRYVAAQLISSVRQPKGTPIGRLIREGDVYIEFDAPAEGNYTVRVRAWAEQSGPAAARMAIRVGEQTLATVDVDATKEMPGAYEGQLRLPAGRHRVAAAFLNSFSDSRHPDPARRERVLIVEGIEIGGPNGEIGAAPESHRRIIFRTPAGDDEACAREILTQFASRAYRRPPTAQEVDRLARLVEVVQADGGSFEAGIQLAVQAALVSPHFLFRVELDADTGPAVRVRRLNGHQLASRLSYFLWSTMPDEELFRLADQGKLADDAVLAAQVRRMLADPRSQALIEHFAGQWLQLRNLSLVAPDRKRFRDFDTALRSAMQMETELFFASIVREDRSVLDLLDADYTFLNERLAKHYGIAEVTGEEFRKFPLPDRRRGGLLTHASVLTITSNPTRTSPVKRGKWVLEQILGTPPPPPPPGIEELEQVKLAGTLRQKLEQHRANPSCATCHARMDPLGFALENFDAIGAWRDQEEDRDIDASGALPGGKGFAGAAELRGVLRAQPEVFVRSLARKMLTYALGRGLEPYDTQAVFEIADKLPAADYRMSALILEIVRSEPFQMRRGGGTD